MKQRGAVPIALDQLDLARAAQDAEIWERVIRKVRTGLMPPARSPHPDKPIADGFAAWLEQEIDQRGGQPSEPGADRSVPSAESNRIPERGPRSARARRGRRIAPPGRRCQLRIRQYRRSPQGVADADGAISRGGAENQPSGARRRAARAQRRLLQAAGRSAAGRPSPRPADRHARRHGDSVHVSSGRRIRNSRPARARHSRERAGVCRAAAARGEPRRRTRAAVHGAAARAARAANVRTTRRRRRHRRCGDPRSRRTPQPRSRSSHHRLLPRTQPPTPTRRGRGRRFRRSSSAVRG